MKQRRLLFIICLVLFICSTQLANAQCSICTKTAQQLGEGPAKSLNSGIIYLMSAPLIIMGFIGFRWWKREKKLIEMEKNN